MTRLEHRPGEALLPSMISRLDVHLSRALGALGFSWAEKAQTSPVLFHQALDHVTPMAARRARGWIRWALRIAPEFTSAENHAAAELWRAMLRGEHPEVWRSLSAQTVWAGVLDGPAFAELAEPVAQAFETVTLTEVLNSQANLRPLQDKVRSLTADDPSPEVASARLQAWLQPRTEAFQNHDLLLRLFTLAAGHEDARAFLGANEAQSAALLETLAQHEADVRTLRRYLTDQGQVRVWTRKPRTLEALVPYLAGLFDEKQTYTESEVTAVLQPWLLVGNVAEVRRTLIEYRWLARTPNGAAYWRLSPEMEHRGPALSLR